VTARRRPASNQDDLFSQDPAGLLASCLDKLNWPEQGRFPVNRGSVHVHSVVLEDLVHSSDPLIVAGFSSIGEIVSFMGAWIGNGCSGVARLVLGTEAFRYDCRDRS
jgi:hypothetical protein